MKKLSMLAMLFCTTTLISFVNAPQKLNSSASGQTTVQVLDYTGFTVTIPCTGETVVFEGNLIFVSTWNVNNNRYNLNMLANPQQLRGTGSLGNTYVATGNTQHRMNGSFNNGQAVHQFVNNFRMIGQGQAANFTVHDVYHVTIDANNVLTSWVERGNVACN